MNEELKMEGNRREEWNTSDQGVTIKVPNGYGWVSKQI